MTEVGVAGPGWQNLLHLMNCLHMRNVQVLAAADTSKKACVKERNLGVKNRARYDLARAGRTGEN